MSEYIFEKKKLQSYLGDTLYNVLKSYNVIIAGGTITSLFTNSEINDIDVYFRSKADLSNFLIEEMAGKWVIAKTEKAFLFKYEKIKVQAIYFKYFNNAEEIFDTFDFTVCMGAYDFSTEDFILHKDFLKHNSQRILKFNHLTAYPLISAMRVDKYKNKGYRISKPEFIRVLLTILNTNITDYKSLKEQMGGMYGENYDTMLEPQEGEEFDLLSIIAKMKDISVDDSYFEKAQFLIDVDDWEECVYEALGEKFRCFKYRDKYYKIVSGEIKRCKNYNEEKHILVDASEIIQFPLIRYKYVRSNLHSFFKNDYVYKVGEYNFPKSTSHGLYAVTKDKLNTCSYSNSSDNLLLELRIDSIDDIFDFTELFDGTSSYKRVFVVRQIPKEEEMQLRGKTDDKQTSVNWWD